MVPPDASLTPYEGIAEIRQPRDFENARANAYLIVTAPDFLAACDHAPEGECTPLEWLSALLVDLEEGDWPAQSADPEAAYTALAACGVLLANLRAAVKKAKGE